LSLTNRYVFNRCKKRPDWLNKNWTRIIRTTRDWTIGPLRVGSQVDCHPQSLDLCSIFFSENQRRAAWFPLGFGKMIVYSPTLVESFLLDVLTPAPVFSTIRAFQIHQKWERYIYLLLAKRECTVSLAPHMVSYK